MTVVLALRCADGLVIASDSQATEILVGGTPVRSDTQKLRKLGKSIIYGASGSQGLAQRITDKLADQAPKLGTNRPARDIGEVIRCTATPLQQNAMNSWVQIPGTVGESWGAVFAGWAKDGPFIFEVDINGAAQFKSPSAATGSGYAFAGLALTSVLHHNVEMQTLVAARAIAYRVVEDICKASAYGVGLPVQMGVVTKDGAQELDTTELEETNQLVNLWKAREIELLGELAPSAVPLVESGGDEPTLATPAPPS